MFFRLLDWVERDLRKKHERIIVFKNMFDVDDFEVCLCFAFAARSNSNFMTK